MKKNVHFIGIEGIGMSGLATILLEKGVCEVSGSDMKAGAMAERLKTLGAKVTAGHAVENLPLCEAKVIVSSEIPQDNPEFAEAKKKGYPILHRSDLLKELMEGYEVLAVTGTHGKTTTTALLSHILYEAGSDPSFAVGGIMLNFGTNARYGRGKYFVAEADESDGTFLKYPYIGAIVTNIDTDHLAHFGSIENLEAAFKEFMQKAPDPNMLIFCGDDERLWKLQPNGLSYGFSPRNDIRIESIRACEDGSRFDVRVKGVLYKDIAIQLLGRHNVLNATAVFGLALSLGMRETTIRSAFYSFHGTKRRLEKKEAGSGCLVYDDYAHHPTEIRATLSAIRQAIGERRLVAIYQPHRPSRMRHIAHELEGCFQEAEVVVITDLYLSGEQPEGISTKEIFDIVSRAHPGAQVLYIPRKGLVEGLLKTLRPHDVALFLGAGDITKAADDVGRALKVNPLQKWKVGVVYGGMSSENKISRLSAQAIWEALDRNLYDVTAFELSQNGAWKKTQGIEQKEPEERQECLFPKELFEAILEMELFIPVLHGQFGEDGSIQGFFEMLHKPYVGCSFSAAAVAMDKAMTKQIAQSIGIRVVPYMVIDKREWKKRSYELLEETIQRLRAPYFVKPVHLGSSVGIEKVLQEEELREAIDKALCCDERVLVEQTLYGRELEFAAFGNEEVIVPPPAEIITGGRFNDYQAKYGQNCMRVLAKAEISLDKEEEGCALAKKIYLALGCSGLTKIDFFLDEKGYWYLNEVNPFPGFTKNNTYPSVWKAQGISYQELVNRLVIVAFSRFRKNRRSTSVACQLGKKLETLCVM